MAAELWRIALSVPAAAVAAVAEALAPHCDSVATFGDDSGPWLVEGFCRRAPSETEIVMAVTLIAASLGVPAPEVAIAPMAGRNWLAENVAGFPPIVVGRWYIHDSQHAADMAPAGLSRLRIDAGTAFGSGRHGSTAGCLAELATAPRLRLRRALDLGCGSGVLAVAIAKRWRCDVIASDIDAAAVAVAADNAKRNGVGPLVTTIRAAGYAHPRIRAVAPYDLIVANILARPLRRMARDLSRHLSTSGLAVLSGFLVADAPSVQSAHAAFGMRVQGHLDVDGWRTLLLSR